MTNTLQPGASAADWSHWQKLGLTPDLLPVVSDLTAKLSPKSQLSSANIGKVPSQFNRDGYIVGIPDWTTHVATDKQIDRWSANPRLGICLQTGKKTKVYCFDNDISDPELAKKIREYIEMVVGPLPMRYRSNSSKFMLLFRCDADLAKRVIKTLKGAIEWLGKGQEVVLVGTHPSGARYEWLGGLPETIPELSPAEVELLWTGLQKEFGSEPELAIRGGMAHPRVKRAPNASLDDTANFLDANGWVKSWTTDGRLNIRCPFEEEHTQPSNETGTQYFPAGVGGFERGHFKCMHAHCASRIDSDFTDAIGLMDEEFEDLSTKELVLPDGTVSPPPLPAPRYSRNRGGQVFPTAINLEAALSRPDQCGMRLAWDTFRDEIMWASPGDKLDWQPFTDYDYVRVRILLQKPRSDGGIDFKDIPRELFRDVLHYVAHRNKIDSAQVWANSLKWDGKARAERFFSTYFNAPDNAYTRAVGLYTWTALAGRALVPGIKADMAIILKSAQGTIKTEGIKAMAPHEDAFTELDMAKHDDQIARLTRGKLVCEISELRGLNSREHGAIKSWVSRRHEEWVPKYKEFATKFPRRFICFGTTNEDEFLADSTGERRWLPMDVGRTNLEALKRDCEQLWAEGVALFKDGGIRWQAAEHLARAEHHKYKVQDPWHDPIVQWLNEEAFGGQFGICQGDLPVRTNDLLQSACGVNVQNITRREHNRVAAILRSEGYEPTTVRNKGDTGNVYRAWVNARRVEAARQRRVAYEELG